MCIVSNTYGIGKLRIEYVSIRLMTVSSQPYISPYCLFITFLFIHVQSSGTINSETGEKHRRHLMASFRSDDNVMGTAPVVSCSTEQSMLSHPVPQASALPVATRRSSGGGSGESESVTPQAMFVESRRMGDSNMTHLTNMTPSRSIQSEMSLASFTTTSSSDEFGSSADTPQGAAMGGIGPETSDATSIEGSSSGFASASIITESGSEKGASTSGPGDSPVDIKVLEQELVRIAPTIRDLFQKIQKQTSGNLPSNEDELQKVKGI